MLFRIAVMLASLLINMATLHPAIADPAEPVQHVSDPAAPVAQPQPPQPAQAPVYYKNAPIGAGWG
jgi:hypothetical protein